MTSVGLTLETAGTMFGGKRFWALARIGEQAIIDNHDRIKGYLLLLSSADGLRATEARHTSIRVVCRNTLRMSDMQDSEGQVKISHHSQFVAENVKRKLRFAPKTFKTFMENMRRLADVRVSDAKAATITRKLLGKDEEKTGKRFEKVMGFVPRRRHRLRVARCAGHCMGWLNSATEAVDHHARSKSDARKLDSILFGADEKLKATILGQALELVA